MLVDLVSLPFSHANYDLPLIENKSVGNIRISRMRQNIISETAIQLIYSRIVRIFGVMWEIRRLHTALKTRMLSAQKFLL